MTSSTLLISDRPLKSKFSESALRGVTSTGELNKEDELTRLERTCEEEQVTRET